MILGCYILLVNVRTKDGAYMLAKEADNLEQGDRVITLNGIYKQDARVTKVTKDHRNVRWISYYWDSPKNERKTGCKRHNSVYLP